MGQIRKWQIWGSIITVIAGSLLHFVYGWSGENKIVALFGAVNESTWEHLKMAFWPTFLFSIVEWQFWGRGTKNYCAASAIRLASMPFVILGLYYGWQLFFPESLIWDISIFVLAIFTGYYLGYRILRAKRNYNAEIMSSVFIVILLAVFSTFTYFAPESILTKDPATGGYGIPRQSSPSDKKESIAPEATVIISIAGEEKKLNVESKELMPLSPEEVGNFDEYSGAPRKFDDGKSRMEQASVIYSLDRSKALVIYNNFDITTEKNPFDDSYPVVKTDEYTCVISSRSCSASSLLADAKKATGSDFSYFGYWDSVKGVLYGHISADGWANAAPVFSYNTQTGEINRTDVYPIEYGKGGTNVSFSPSYSQFVVYESRTNNNENFDAVIFDSHSMKEAKRFALTTPFGDGDGISSSLWSNDETKIYISTRRHIHSLDLVSGKESTIYADRSKDSTSLYWGERLVMTKDGRYLAFVDYYNPVLGYDSAPTAYTYDKERDVNTLRAINLEDTRIILDVLSGNSITLSLDYR